MVWLLSKASGADFIVALVAALPLMIRQRYCIVVNNPDFADVKSLEGVADTRQRLSLLLLYLLRRELLLVTINYVIIDERSKKKDGLCRP